MAVPNYQVFLLPLLEFSSDSKEHNTSEARDALARSFKLSQEDRSLLLPSGKQTVYINRIGWALTYLKKAWLLKPTEKGKFQITKRGLEFLKDKPEYLCAKDLEQFSEFQDFKQRKRTRGVTLVAEEPGDKTPEDLILEGYGAVRHQLADELLERVKNCSPEFFERMVVNLLVNMGYGGSLKDAGEAIGKSGDEGIDGVIKEDPLGLDVVFIQAKRWENNISAKDVREFVGALEGRHAKKGVFITTSVFSQPARDFVAKVGSKVVLIGGDMLSQLMIDHGVGVSTSDVLEIKKIDSDFFEEDI